MPPVNFTTLADLVAAIGRGKVFYAPKWTPGGAQLALTHLGETEGDIVFNTNAEVSAMTFPELSGPAKHAADFTGEDPVLEIPLYLADPALMAIISPAGSANGGRSRRSRVTEYTLVVLPEALFGDVADGDPAPVISYTTLGGWELDGVAFTADQTAILEAALWLWRGYFTKPPRRFRGGAGDAKKNIETATFQVMHHGDMPEGHQLYTSGDPADATIDIGGVA